MAAVALHVDADRSAGSPRNSVQARPNAISRMSWMPAWNAAGTSPSSIAVVSASSSTDRRPALA
ncbi:hypothetical protein O980_12795 [Mycobacterium avium subsp. paratuberculosis 08-8281]|nr:hypothetical protein O980_12795 [Mycobacterium avium subsp. paratuberculosis 08-8281]